MTINDLMFSHDWLLLTGKECFHLVSKERGKEDKKQA